MTNSYLMSSLENQIIYKHVIYKTIYKQIIYKMDEAQNNKNYLLRWLQQYSEMLEIRKDNWSKLAKWQEIVVLLIYFLLSVPGA